MLDASHFLLTAGNNRTLVFRWLHEGLLVSNPAFFKSESHSGGKVVFCDFSILLNGLFLCTGKLLKAHFLILKKSKSLIISIGYDKSKTPSPGWRLEFVHHSSANSHSLAIFGTHEIVQLEKFGMLTTYGNSHETTAEDVFLPCFFILLWRFLKEGHVSINICSHDENEVFLCSLGPREFIPDYFLRAHFRKLTLDQVYNNIFRITIERNPVFLKCDVFKLSRFPVFFVKFINWLRIFTLIARGRSSSACTQLLLGLDLSLLEMLADCTDSGLLYSQ